MTVPHSNLLKRAFKLIARDTVQWYQFTGCTTNSYGVDVNTYAQPIDVSGSLQAVPQNYYIMMGLDFQKNYVTFFCPVALLDLQRNVSGDVIKFNGRVYTVESLTDWYTIDGWVQALCVLTDGVPIPSTNYLVDTLDNFIVDPDGNNIIEA